MQKRSDLFLSNGCIDITIVQQPPSDSSQCCTGWSRGWCRREWVRRLSLFLFYFKVWHIWSRAALLTPLKKGQVKLSCQKFLKSHLEEYKTALLVSHEKATSFLNAIVNLWFLKHHWLIPVTQEELPTWPPFPTSADGFELLTEKQATLKGKVIERMRKVSHPYVPQDGRFSVLISFTVIVQLVRPSV